MIPACIIILKIDNSTTFLPVELTVFAPWTGGNDDERAALATQFIFGVLVKR
jgi:hypothetical protein